MAGLAEESQPELNVLSKHGYKIAVIISQNLSYFSLKFVESVFITRDQSSNVLDVYGVENLEKASRLLNYAYANLGIIRSPEEREKWFKCFLSHFESEAPYQELVASLREEYRKASAPSSSPHTTNTADNTSSTHLPPSDKRSGKETPEYKAVIYGYGDITRALQMTPSANAELSRRFIQENWIEPGVKCSNDDLLNSTLLQIRQKASQFQVFLSMLRDMAGMDLVVKQLQDKVTPPSVQSVTPVAAVGVTYSAEKPKLQQLLSFPTRTGESINIMQRVGTQHDELGYILLNDGDGSLVDQITSDCHHKSASITKEIMKRWIRGEGKQPVTWKTLTDALTAIGFTELAKSILESL